MKLFTVTKGVALLHFGRVGSTLISTMICQNKLFYSDGELYEKVRVGDIKIPDKISDQPGLLIKQRRAKFFYRDYLISLKPIPEEHLRENLLNMTYEDMLECLTEAHIDKMILIKRKNYLKHYLSGALAKEWKKYHFKKDEKSQLKKIKIDCHNVPFGTHNGSLLQLFQKFDDYYEEIERLTPNALILSYEDDIEIDPYVAYDKVKNYLKLRKDKPEIILSKSNTFTNEEVIENYDEVEKYLKNTSYEWML